MKLWLVERPMEEVSYDEYDAVVVRAQDEVEAREIARKMGVYVYADGTEDDNSTFPVENATVTEFDAEGEAGVVLASFCAG